jgi:hypothetical protein
MRVLLASVLALVAVVPTAVTLPADGIGPNTATLRGEVGTDGKETRWHFEYGTTESYGLTTPEQTTSTSGAVAAPVSGLTANTTYHYRLVATNGDGTARGEDRTFTTTPNPRPPAISNQRALDIGPDSVRLGASITARESATTYRFEYGTTTRYGNQTPVQSLPAGSSAVPVSATVDGLQPFTRYHWRLVATNAAGTARGRDRTFTTARLPSAVTLTASPSRVPWGRALTLGGRVSGVGAGRIPVALQTQRFPFDGGFTEIARTTTGNEGGYLFRVANLWESTRYRVITATRVVVASPTVEARSAMVVGRNVRHISRRRARIFGSALPGVAGEARLQRRSLTTGRWRTVRRRAVAPVDEVRVRYAFRVRRQRRTRAYRVVVAPNDGGAHVSGRSRRVFVRAAPRR